MSDMSNQKHLGGKPPVEALSKEMYELHRPFFESWELFLCYVTTGHLSLTGVEPETIRQLLKLSYNYGVMKLHDVVSQYLQKGTLLIQNLSKIEHFSQRELHEIYQNPDAFLESEAILRLPAQRLREILQRDSFCVDEIEIFEAVKRWAANRPNDEETLKVVEAIRLPLISEDDLLTVVKKSNLVPADRLLDAIEWQAGNRGVDPPLRGSLLPEINLADTERGAKVITGEHRDILLAPDSSEEDDDDDASDEDDDEDSSNDETSDKDSDANEELTYHDIGDPEGITVDLGGMFVINHIFLRLSDRNPPAYFYYVDVSMSKKNWRRVVDYSKYCCTLIQKLYFEPSVCRYIRVVGTRSPQDGPFRLRQIQAIYTENRLQLSQGICIPKCNVASIQMGATVIKGKGRNRNELINGNVTDYDNSSGYVYHQVGPGSIIIQLAQPYIISSMAMLLWDLDSRTYSYCIETSVDWEEWTQVVDRTSHDCKSWQILNFEPRPVVFIKIIGTASSANDIFQCVHFECPAGKRRVTGALSHAEKTT